jgi:hypothetical protein
MSLAENLQADLIAIGSSGLHGAMGLVSGSVASALARHAPCSILLATSPRKPEHRGPVVIASDGSAGAVIAADPASRAVAATTPVMRLVLILVLS